MMRELKRELRPLRHSVWLPFLAVGICLAAAMVNYSDGAYEVAALTGLMAADIIR